MPTPAALPPLTRYLVELTPAENGFDDIQTLTARSRVACRDLTRQGTPVRFLRSVFVPEDGTCLLIFEAATAGVVEEAGRRAALRVGPASEALRPAATDAVQRAP